ncbi:MAG: hypothetical protein WD357_00660 [Gracilimonas sp.]
MKSDVTREKVLKELHSGQLQKAEQLMMDLFSKQADDLKHLLNQTHHSLAKDTTEQTLKNFVEELRKKLPEKSNGGDNEKEKPEWIEEILLIIEEVEEEVILKQSEERFRATPSDSFFLKTGKLGKRTVRGFKGIITKIENGVRKVVGADVKQAKAWQQKVPLKNIVYLNLLRLSSWNEGWQNELFKLEAETILEADAWTLHSSGLIKEREEKESEAEGDSPERQGNPSKEDLLIFFEEAKKRIEDLRSEYIKILKSEFEEITFEIEEAVTLADTIECPRSEFSIENINRKERDALQLNQRNSDSWRELLFTLSDRVLLSMGFRQLYVLAEERVSGFSESLAELFKVNFEDPQNQLYTQLEEAISLFDDSEGKSPKKVQELSSAHREKMRDFVDQKLLKSINELIENAVLSTKLDRFTSAIPEWTKDQPEKAVLVEELDLTSFPPAYEFNEVDWQVLVQRVLDNQLAKALLPKEIKPEQFMSEILVGYKEIAEIIYTNLEIADEVKKSDDEQPFEVALKGLERAKSKLDEVGAKLGDKQAELKDKILEKHEAAFVKLAVLLAKNDVTDVRLAGAEYKAKETATDWKTKFLVVWANVEEKAELFGRFIWKKVKEYGIVVRKFLGFAEKEKIEGDKTDLATFLSETDEQISGLPFIYRRLFDFQKEVDQRFYIRRPEQFERFKKGYELWGNNFPSTFGIIGEKGSGKSLFISLLKEEVLTKHEVIDINFEDTIWKPDQIIKLISKGFKIEDVSTVDELIEAIGRKKKRIVVILENVQNCYIRNISGFEAIEHLMYLISETNKNILWTVSSTRYGWLFLDKVIDVSDYFTHLVQADNLTPVQIEELILKRHRASGYQLKFIPDEATKKSRSYRKIMDDEEKTQELLKDKYFEKLAKLAEGNPSIAMIFWIRSIKEFDDTHFYINPFEFGTINRIDELESAELFALAAFVLHDTLEPEEMSQILHQPLRECKLMASRLASRSILIKGDHGYMLNHLIYRQVVRVLKEANFIH